MSLHDLLKRSGPQSASLSLVRSFKVYEDSDKTEGRGSQTLRYVVGTRAEADVLAVGLGVWGQPGRIDDVEYVVVSVGGSRFSVPLSAIVDDVRDSKAATRAAVLLRLTPTERAALMTD